MSTRFSSCGEAGLMTFRVFAWKWDADLIIDSGLSYWRRERRNRVADQFYVELSCWRRRRNVDWIVSYSYAELFVWRFTIECWDAFAWLLLFNTLSFAYIVSCYFNSRHEHWGSNFEINFVLFMTTILSHLCV